MMRLRIKSDILIEHRNESKPNKKQQQQRKQKQNERNARRVNRERNLVLKYAWVIMLRKSGYFSR